MGGDEEEYDDEADYTEEFLDDDELEDAIDEAFEEEDEDCSSLRNRPVGAPAWGSGGTGQTPTALARARVGRGLR